MQFRKSLSTPESKRIFQCYATHGKGYGHDPSISGTDIRILLVNAARAVLWADARFDGRNYHCEAARLDAQWKRLGWVMVDGSLPLGELDAVNPDLAQFDYLAAADTSNLPLPASAYCHPPGCKCGCGRK